jgi:hypothetical protein
MKLKDKFKKQATYPQSDLTVIQAGILEPPKLKKANTKEPKLQHNIYTH